MTELKFKQILKDYPFPDTDTTDYLRLERDVWDALYTKCGINENRICEWLISSPFRKIVVEEDGRMQTDTCPELCYYAFEKFQNTILLYQYYIGTTTDFYNIAAFNINGFILEPIGCAQKSLDGEVYLFVDDSDTYIKYDECKSMCSDILSSFCWIAYVFNQIVNTKVSRDKTVFSDKHIVKLVANRSDNTQHQNLKSIVLFESEYANRTCDDKRIIKTNGLIEREYLTKSWNTRGHYRILNNGKRIWVRPHTNARSSDLLSAKAEIKQSIYRVVRAKR